MDLTSETQSIGRRIFRYAGHFDRVDGRKGHFEGILFNDLFILCSVKRGFGMEVEKYHPVAPPFRIEELLLRHPDDCDCKVYIHTSLTFCCTRRFRNLSERPLKLDTLRVQN